jgi:hypothetical protein
MPAPVTLAENTAWEQVTITPPAGPRGAGGRTARRARPIIASPRLGMGTDRPMQPCPPARLRFLAPDHSSGNVGHPDRAEFRLQPGLQLSHPGSITFTLPPSTGSFPLQPGTATITVTAAGQSSNAESIAVTS